MPVMLQSKILALRIQLSLLLALQLMLLLHSLEKLAQIYSDNCSIVISCIALAIIIDTNVQPICL